MNALLMLSCGLAAILLATALLFLLTALFWGFMELAQMIRDQFRSGGEK